jgi:hypothetical protein
VAFETYEHELWTGSGSTRATLQFEASGDIECELHMRWMGSDEHLYHLSGRYEQLSGSYGRIFIRQITVQRITRFPRPATPAESTTEEVDPFALGTDLMYEYLKAARSPVLYHPGEDLTLMRPLGYAGWNEHFDLVLITAPLITQGLDYLRSIQEADSTTGSSSFNDEISDGDDLPPLPTKSVVKHYENLVFALDKMKFARKPDPPATNETPE